MVISYLSPIRKVVRTGPKNLLTKPIKAPNWNNVKTGVFQIPGTQQFDPDGLIGQSPNTPWKDRHLIKTDDEKQGGHLGISDPNSDTFNSGELYSCKEAIYKEDGTRILNPDGSPKNRTWFAKRFDSTDPFSRMRAVREVVFPYVVALLGKPSSILTTFMYQESKDSLYVFRRF